MVEISPLFLVKSTAENLWLLHSPLWWLRAAISLLLLLCLIFLFYFIPLKQQTNKKQNLNKNLSKA